METMTDEAFAEGLARWARTLNGSETYSGAGTFLKAASARLTALARENAALREALAFYRDGFAKEYKRGPTGLSHNTWNPTEALLEDCGETARAALADTDGKEG